MGIMHTNGVLTGMDCHALQTQFPPSAIELRDGPQLRLPNFHSASTAAAAANPSATPINGLSTANQKEMFQSEFSGVGFLFITLSQAFEDRHFRKVKCLFVCFERSQGDPGRRVEGRSASLCARARNSSYFTRSYLTTKFRRWPS
jgi:hypothetical protein